MAWNSIVKLVIIVIIPIFISNFINLNFSSFILSVVDGFLILKALLDSSLSFVNFFLVFLFLGGGAVCHSHYFVLYLIYSFLDP